MNMLKKLKPVTPSTRSIIRLNYNSIVTTKAPEKSLIEIIKGPTGRTKGKITVHHKGGRLKRYYRIVDFKRKIRNLEGVVKTIEFDPNRSSLISLVSYSNGQKAYILTPEGLKVGDKIIAGENAPLSIGNALPLEKIPTGTPIHNIELNPGSGCVLVRSAGTSATITGFDGKYAIVRLPSKEVRFINSQCYATIGVVSNADWRNRVVGKAGTNRLRGIRPTVRGMAKDPKSHPHGGGEGKGVIGHIPKDRWGNIRGKITRRVKNRYNFMRLYNRKGQKIVLKK